MDFLLLTFDIEMCGSVPDFPFGFKRPGVEGGLEVSSFFENKCFSCPRDMELFYIKYNTDIFVPSICLIHIELEKMKVMIP